MSEEEEKMNLFQMSKTFTRTHDYKVKHSNGNDYKRFLVIILVVSMVIQDMSTFTQNFGTEASLLCFSMVCGFAPFVAKSCCRSFKYCCAQYQSWLAPLLEPHDLVKEHRFVASSMNIIPRLPISSNRQSRKSSLRSLTPSEQTIFSNNTSNSSYM